jgi:hypothetical protein
MLLMGLDDEFQRALLHVERTDFSIDSVKPFLQSHSIMLTLL